MTPQVPCRPSPSLVLSPSSRSKVYSLSAATTSPFLCGSAVVRDVTTVANQFH